MDYRNRRFLNISLLLLVIISGAVAAWLFRLPPPVLSQSGSRRVFGVYDNRQLVQLAGDHGRTTYHVEDSAGNFLFNIPLKESTIDFRFRDGRLRFHDNESGRDGFIDTSGYITIVSTLPPETDAPDNPTSGTAPQSSEQAVNDIARLSTSFTDAAPEDMRQGHPFAAEAKKVLAGKLSETDSVSRRKILSYCEHLRTAYTTNDIDFIRQVFSENALIIVGHNVRTGKLSANGMAHSERVDYSIRSKKQYLRNLQKVFDSNQEIKVDFSDFKIMRHPTVDGIYGVTMRQEYVSDRYSDSGYLFLLWDFRDRSMPLIHVRTWQPDENTDGEDVIGIGDFNLQ